MKRAFRMSCLFILCVAVLFVSGCRVRIIAHEGESSSQTDAHSGGYSGSSWETDSNNGDDTSRTDEKLPPKISIEADIEPTSGTGIGAAETSGSANKNLRSDLASEDRVNIDEQSDSGGETRPSDDGGIVETIMDEYTEVLEKGLGTLYECQIAYVYMELTQTYLTVNRNSPEHRLILDAGGYNAGEKRGDDKLTIDDEWILRKNPALIVKLVAPSVLGPGVRDTSSAQAIRSELISRPGWNGVSAVVNSKVLILSESLLESEEGLLIAKLYMAKEMYPSLFSDIDVDEICDQLLESSFGPAAVGSYSLD